MQSVSILGRTGVGALLLFGLAVLASVSAAAQDDVDARVGERIAMMRIESPSFVSFQNEATQPIATGGTIRFRLETPAADGSIPFTIEPEDVRIPAFPIGRSARGKYELVAAISGVMRRGPEGLTMTFPAKIRATTIPAEGARKSLEYDLVFTTAQASATSSGRTKTVAPVGKAVNETDGTVELVVATTNRMDAGPIPGAATFAYLVGKFDVVPGKSEPVKAAR